jgi:hypothetical protein
MALYLTAWTSPGIRLIGHQVEPGWTDRVSYVKQVIHSAHLIDFLLFRDFACNSASGYRDTLGGIGLGLWELVGGDMLGKALVNVTGLPNIVSVFRPDDVDALVDTIFCGKS